MRSRGNGNYRGYRGGWRANYRGGGRGRGRGLANGNENEIEKEEAVQVENYALDGMESIVNGADAHRQFEKRSRGRRGGYGGNNFKRGFANENQPELSSSSSDEEVVKRGGVQTGIRLKPVIPGWSDYFPEVRYKKGCFPEKLMNAFMTYLSQRNDWRRTAKERGHFFIDFEQLKNDSDIASALETPNFADAFCANVNDYLQSMGLAAHQIILDKSELKTNERNVAIREGIYPLQARIINFSSPMPFRMLRADSYAQMVVVCGTVVRMSGLRPTCVELAYKCLSCGNETTMPVTGVTDAPVPKKCRPVTGERGCLGRTFVVSPHSGNTLFVDSRTIRIQEVARADDENREAIPRCIDVELQRDLAGHCAPGDVVTVCGIVQLRPAKEGQSFRAADDSTEFKLCIDAVSIKHHSDAVAAQSGISSSQEAVSNGSKLAAFSDSDLEAIRRLRSKSNIFQLLVNSLCPEIFGHELIKAGLVLSLFAGRSDDNSNSQRSASEVANETLKLEADSENDNAEQTLNPATSHHNTRANVHVLLVGDPGLGKSQLLRSLSDCAPRVVYVCGSSASTAGLGVAVNRDRSTLQAGALVLSDRGICCIDELDKMGGQEAVLLEVMEQQTLSVAKAGFVCSLPARSSIIAAANPAGGRYNHEKSVADNIRLPGAGALLSRFDLVFCILDQHDEDHDRMLSEHVLASYVGGGGKSKFDASMSSSRVDLQSGHISQIGGKTLARRLIATEPLDLISHSLFRKYVNYAIQAVHPRLTPKAATLLRTHYLEMRSRAKGFTDAPITTRQLESMIRLAECRARLELREDVLESDARDVIDLMQGTLADVFANKTSDLVVLKKGSSAGRTAVAKKMIPLIQRFCDENARNDLSREDIIVAVGPMRLPKEKLIEAIEYLNSQGFLLKKLGKYHFTASSF